VANDDQQLLQAFGAFFCSLTGFKNWSKHEVDIADQQAALAKENCLEFQRLPVYAHWQEANNPVEKCQS
jgi:hypothetical protein